MFTMRNAQSIVGYSKAREKDDFYPTPAETTHAIMLREEFVGTILEPCCGDGAMSEVIKKYNPEVTSRDMINRGYGKGGCNFYFHDTKEKYNNIITNPPFKHAVDFVKISKKIAHSKIAMLLKLVFLEGSNRFSFFQDKEFPLARVWVFSKRQTLTRAGEEKSSSGMIAYAWFVWDKKHEGEPLLRWIGEK